jgi:hypothetical protein
VLIVLLTVTRRTKRCVSGLRHGAGLEPPRARWIAANIAKQPELPRKG